MDLDWFAVGVILTIVAVIIVLGLFAKRLIGKGFEGFKNFRKEL